MDSMYLGKIVSKVHLEALDVNPLRQISEVLPVAAREFPPIKAIINP